LQNELDSLFDSCHLALFNFNPKKSVDLEKLHGTNYKEQSFPQLLFRRAFSDLCWSVSNNKVPQERLRPRFLRRTELRV